MVHKNILVLGGAGYIGSIVSHELVRKGFSVVVFDNLDTGHEAAVSSSFINGDIGNQKLVEKIIRDNHIDAVLHFAGHSILSESIENPGKFFKNNVSSTIAVLEAMKNTSVKKIIFSSSASVYGTPKEIPITENHEIDPISPYGETKIMIERLLNWYSKLFGITAVSLRYFNAAGATETHGEDHFPESHLIPLVLDAACGKRESLNIFGNDYDTPDGTCVRDFIHVLDLADAHIKALDYGKTCSFNLGSGEGYSVRQILDLATKITQKKIKSEIKPRRFGDPPILVASYKKAMAELGWKPKLGISEMIESAWKWKLSHPNGYKK